MLKLLKLFIANIIIIIILAGCSCEKRLQRLRIYCPDCVTTERINDTVIIPEYRFDTAFVCSHEFDTITIVKDRMQIELLKYHDTVYLRTTIPADTVVKTIEVEKLVKVENDVGAVYVGLLVFLIMFVLFLLYLLSKS